MDATATQVKNNFGHYLKVAEDEDVRIIRNGRYVAKLTSPREDRVQAVTRLFGILDPDTPDIRVIRAERRALRESTD